MKNIICIALIIVTYSTVTALPSSAGEKQFLSGAFGIRFGDILQGKTQSECKQDKLCKVKPKKPYYAFSSYFVKTTPDKHKVYEIVGFGEANNYAEVVYRSKKVASIIEKKYGIALRASGYTAPNGIVSSFWTGAVGQSPNTFNPNSLFPKVHI